MTTATPLLRGYHVLAAMIAFFVIVIAVNAGFVFAAVQSFPGEDEPRSYLQGLNYNETLAHRRAQAALGWHASAAIVRARDRTVVNVALSDETGRPIDGATIEGELRRPAESGHDIALRFVPIGHGVYRATPPAIAEGDWLLRAHARYGSATFTLERRQDWRP